MTVVFGNNGSGKSGYTRILKSACTARHRSTILSNIYDKNNPSSETSATITYRVGDENGLSVNWKNPEYPHSELSAISVFDRECSKIHIGNENEVSVPFQPLGLDIPEKLVDVYKRVECTLKQKQENETISQNAIFRHPVWKEKTPVGKIIMELSHDSSADNIREKIHFSAENKAQLKTLNELLTKDPAKQINDFRTKLSVLVRLENQNSKLVKQFSESKWNELSKCLNELAATRKEAQIFTDQTFDKATLENVGTDEWKILWEAARKFSSEGVYPEKKFPNIEVSAVCVLCQQPLEEEAKTRMVSFETYVKSNIEEKRRSTEQKFEELSKEVISTVVQLANVRGALDILRLESEDAYSKGN